MLMIPKYMNTKNISIFSFLAQNYTKVKVKEPGAIKLDNCVFNFLLELMQYTYMSIHPIKGFKPAIGSFIYYE